MFFDNSLNADTSGYVLADAARFSYDSPITEERDVALAKRRKGLIMTTTAT